MGGDVLRERRRLRLDAEVVDAELERRPGGVRHLERRLGGNDRLGEAYVHSPVATGRENKALLVQPLAAR